MTFYRGHNWKKRKDILIPTVIGLLIVIVHANLFTPFLEVNAAPALLYSDPSDGLVSSDGGINPLFEYLWVGDEASPPNVYIRAFVKFSLAGISGTLSSARLHLYVRASDRDGLSDNTSPLTNPGLGDCQIVHIDDYGALDPADFNAPSIGNDPGVLIGGAETPNVGYISIDVKAAMQDDVNNGRLWSTYMIKMSTDTDGDGQVDRWFFYSSDSPGADRDPYIEYVLASPALVDQSNDVARGAVANTYDWGQSFTPTMNRLAGIDLALDSVGNVNTYSVTVNVRTAWGGPIIGSATTDVAPGVRNNDVGEFTSFTFPTPLELTPGIQYIIEVDLSLYYHQGGTSDMISWYSTGGDTYPNGQAIQNGALRSDDMAFRTLGMRVADFSLSASPPELTVPIGSSQTSTITITSLFGFSSPVELSYSWFGDAPSDVTINLPGPVTPPSDDTGTSTLQVSAGAAATIGTFTLKVTGISGAVSHSLDVAVEITEAPTTTPTPTPTPTPSPSLTPTLTPTPTITPTPTPSTPTPTVTPLVPGCIIATAAYNSPLAQEVAYMRHVRDDLIGSNQVGRQIVNGWNVFYYSWSPPLANLIATYGILRPVFQAYLIPLIGIIHITAHIYNTFAFINMSYASVVAFLFAAASSAMVYILAPIIAFQSVCRKRFKSRINS